MKYDLFTFCYIFMNSDINNIFIKSNILILVGEEGIGKTSFLHFLKDKKGNPDNIIIV